MPHVFDPFTQAEASLTREHGGLGLGLAITRHILELHGGKVTAESEGVGKGSVFIISVPVSEAGPDTLPAEKGHQDKKVLFGAVPDLSGVRALVVDDEPDTLAMLKAVLEYANAEVTLASNASDAFDKIQTASFDVLLIDIMMPGEDGYSLLHRIRKMGPEKAGNTPAAALTARVTVEDRTAALRSGFQMYLPKPIEPSELVVVVQALSAGKNA